MPEMKKIQRAKTCQNCKHSLFGQKNTDFGGGKKINGLCMKYADAPMPNTPIKIEYVFTYYGYMYNLDEWDLAVTMFKDIRVLSAIPTWEMFYKYFTKLLAPSEFEKRKDKACEWYQQHYDWSAWWIRNWQTVAERRIDGTTVCDEWDGTQTSKFYKERKVK